MAETNHSDDGVDYKRQAEDLMAVLEVARHMGAATALDDLLQLVIQESMRVLDAERASLFLFDKKTNELYSKIAVGTGSREIRFPASMGIAGACATSQKTVNVPDAYEDSRFNREFDKKTGFRTHNILACPLNGFDGGLVGVLQVLNKRAPNQADGFRPFNENDVRLAETLAVQAGVALERSRVLDEYVERQRLARELQLAHSIQQRLLPQEAPKLKRFDIAGWNQPAEETGGDCFDFMEIENNRLVFAIGDATGHGIGPSLISTECRALVRAVTSLTDDLHKGIMHVNRLICADLSPGHFVTLFLGVIDLDKNTLEYISAGQGPVLMLEKGTGQIKQLETSGAPLGIDEDLPYDDPILLPFGVGDTLAVLTDGFYEWANFDGKQFGEAAVNIVLRETIEKSARETISALHRSVLTHANSAPQMDDLTAVIIKRTL